MSVISYQRSKAARWSWSRLLIVIGLSALAWAVVAMACLMVGSTSTGWPATYEVFVLRREVVLLSSLVGAGLAAAGVTYQAILRNPLADPYLLGVSSGAALFAYLWHLPAIAAMTAWMTFYGEAASQQVFAFTGAVVTVSVVLALSNRHGRLEPVTLLLVGVIVNALNGAVYLLVYSIVGSMPSSEGALGLLIAGIKTGLTTQEKVIATVIFAVLWIVLLAISGELNAAALSDVEAEALGVRIQRLRWLGLIVASLMTASAVAISGPIGFIGLICPHLARLFVGSDQRRLLPVATALGAALLASADAASRLMAATRFAHTLLPVSVITSLFGGPFFLLLLIQTRRRADVAEGRA